MKIFLKSGLLVVSALALSACGIFGDDEDEELKPAELTRIETKVKVRKVWSQKLGKDAKFLRVALRPVGDGNRIYAASRDGNVFALDPESGKLAWRSELDIDLSAGPGVGGDIVVVVASDGNVVALDGNDGSERWRTDFIGESLATPLVTDDAVIIQTVDNRLRALEAFDGRERWTVIQSMPALTMRGSASPIEVGSSIIAGFDNGRLVAVDTETGNTMWESLLAPPTGRSDLDRLSDIDGLMAVVGQDVYAAGYQGRIGAIAAESGQVMWDNEISTHAGVAADWNSVYTAQDDGTLIALTRRNGNEIWRTESLLRREPTLPVPFNLTVVTGDFEGYLHFFSNVDGEAVARLRVGGAVTTAPVVVSNRLYVQSDNGTLTAYVIDQPERPTQAPDISDGGT